MSEPFFPDEKAAPKPKKQPKYRRSEENWADNEELVKKAMQFASNCYNVYQSQPERSHFVDETAKKADRMARCSQRRDTADRQYQDTQSNVSSTMVIRRLNVLTSIENDLYFPQNGDMPMGYSPYNGSDEYTEEEGRAIADSHNLLLEYYFEVDDMQKKIEDSVFFLNKYGQQAYAIEWDYRSEMRRKREPTGREEPDFNIETGEEIPGKPKGFRITEREFVIANNPTLRTIDTDNFYFDARIDDMQMQSAILERSFDTLSDAAAMQRTGAYMNVGKLMSNQLYTGDRENDQMVNRQDNADEDSSEDDQSTLLERWDCWLRLPINEDGEWDEEGTYPTWHWATFYGNLSGTSVCTRLIRNPYFHNKNPYNWVHSHRDDKGAFHMCIADIVESLYEEHTTCINQYFDNKTLINKTPFLVRKGNAYSTDMTAGKNKVIYVKDMDGIKEMPVKDTTQTTSVAIDRIERELDKALGTEASILGQAFGSRTSASEAQTANANALKPLLDKARYQGNQLFPWIAEMCMELSRQYSDPNMTISVLRGTEPVEIKPAELWGSLKTKLTAIDKFEDDVTRRAEQNNFFQVWLPILQGIVGQKGLAQLARDVMKDRKITDDVDSIFPANNTFEAERLAHRENEAMVWNGEEDAPQPGEDHETHLMSHKAYMELLKTLPEVQRDPEGEARLQRHIVETEALMSQEQQPGRQLTPAVQPTQQPQVPGAGEQATLSGEVSGDTLAGLQGGL